MSTVDQLLADQRAHEALIAGTTPSAPASAVRPSTTFWCALAASAVGALATFMPWATIHAGLFSHSYNGISADGQITLAASLAAAGLLVAFVRPGRAVRRWALTLVGLAGLVMTGVSGWDTFEVLRDSTVTKSLNGFEMTFHTNLGVGIILTLVAGVAVVATTVVAWRSER